MNIDSPAQDFLMPRLTALVNEATAAGITRDVAVAVLIDLITSPKFDTAAPDPLADSAPHADYRRGPDNVVLVNGMVSGGAPAVDAQDEADFVKPIDPFGPS